MRFFVSGPRLFGGFIRPGVSFGQLNFQRRSSAATAVERRQMVYVITADHGLSKIGISNDPAGRLKSLQTGSAHPLRVALAIPVPTASTAYEIEQEAHALLTDRRASGEWFSVSSNVAIAAVYGAAERLGVDLNGEEEAGRMNDEPNWRTFFMALIVPKTAIGSFIRLAILLTVLGRIIEALPN
jgi:Meiotically up-regulated gene 113